MTDMDEAAERLDAFLARLDRLALEDLRLVALPVPAPEERDATLDVVRRAATEAGRTSLVEQARHRTRKAVMIAYDRHQFDPTWAGLNGGRSLGTTRDRLGLVLAAEDAAIVEVMSDLLDEETLASLAEPFEHAAGMTGATTTPSLSLDRPGRQGLLVRMVFGVMLVVTAIVIGAAQAALGLIAAILSARRGDHRGN